MFFNPFSGPIENINSGNLNVGARLRAEDAGVSARVAEEMKLHAATLKAAVENLTKPGLAERTAEGEVTFGGGAFIAGISNIAESATAKANPVAKENATRYIASFFETSKDGGRGIA